MVRLLEFEVKALLKKLQLPLPRQFRAKELNNPSIYPIVLKSQVPIGGRRKLGGIRFANNQNEAKKHLQELISLKIKGFLPKTILIEEKLSILKEYYCGLIVNRDEKQFNFIFSEFGGIDIEKVAKESQKKIRILPFLPFNRNLNNLADELLEGIDLKAGLKEQLHPIIFHSLNTILSYDAELLEINPLIETHNHQLIIADARMNIDDNALFRQGTYKQNLKYYLTPLELKARELNMSYVELGGDIGVICNGAGLVMGTIDTVHSYGKKAANFLDVGGGADADRMYQALRIISTNKKVKAILINIIGGITRCDEIAKGLIRFLNENKPTKFSLRLTGTNERKGQELLQPYNIKIHHELNEAIQALIL